MKVIEFSSASPEKILSLSVLILFPLMLNLSACKKDKDFLPEPVAQTQDSTTVRAAEDSEILRFLNAGGIDPDEITFGKEYVICDDAAWERTALLETARGKLLFDPAEIIPQQGGGVADRQQGIAENNRSDAVSASRVEALEYYINSSVERDCGQAWVNAIVAGAGRWNLVSNCRVTLTRTWLPVNADIIIGSDLDNSMPVDFRNISSSFVALAQVSQNDRAGRWISINDNADNWNSKLKTVMHELGHTLGYQHNGTNEGSWIFGTPEDDAFSFMNQGPNTSPEFTAGDLRAARLYYPQSLTTPSSFTTVRDLPAGTVRVHYRNSSPVSFPWYWVRLERVVPVPLGWQVVERRFIRSNVSGEATFVSPNHGTGLRYFRISGMNFKRDVASADSPVRSVTL